MANNTTPCGGGCLDNIPCIEKDCACPVFITSDCVDKVTEDLVCSNIKKGQTLTAVLVQLDKFICEKFNQLASYFTLVNVGGGKEIYKGVNGVGQKLLRTLVKVGNLITLNQNNVNDTIEIGLDETLLTTFVQTNQKTYQAGTLLTSTTAGNATTFNVDQANLKTYSTANTTGVGIGVYKDNTVFGVNTQFNLKKLTSNTFSVQNSVDGNSVEINSPVDLNTLLVRVLKLEQMTAPFSDKGAVLVWNKPFNLIPTGWQECIGFRGRGAVGQDTTQPEFAILGSTGGAKEVTLDLENIPPHSHLVKAYAGIAGTSYNLNINSPISTLSGDSTSTTGGRLNGTTKPFSTLDPNRIVGFIEYIL